ncbi:hypothetical protein [Paucibacter soli]|uniref:hypothetical protein n=1 Tax=Paucibacter soli TaxID=3133433 RepID=UPI003094CB8F
MNEVVAKPGDLSDSYWARLSSKDKALYGLVRPQPKAVYTVDVRLDGLEAFLAGQERDLASMGGRLELEPDFQRGHVWTDEQRIHYVENLLRGNAPRLIRFNAADWSGRGIRGDLPAHHLQCIDGLQRMTALRRFLAGEMRLFGSSVGVAELKGSPFDPGRFTVQVAVHEFANRSDLLQFYLDLNSGGTVHADRELERVRGLLRASSAPGSSEPARSRMSAR